MAASSNNDSVDVGYGNCGFGAMGMTVFFLNIISNNFTIFYSSLCGSGGGHEFTGHLKQHLTQSYF